MPHILIAPSIWAALFVAAAAYLLGCFNGAVIVSKYILRDDIRRHGSGNAGLTNFYRVFGGKLTFVVILTDALKAVAAVLVGAALFFGPWLVVGKYWAALFCMLGHMFPCMFGFKGGKGILSGGTVALMMDWRIALAVWGTFFVFFLATKWVSLGSVLGGMMFPLATVLIYRDPVCTALAFVIGALIVWKHRSNLGRIARGEESRFVLHKNRG